MTETARKYELEDLLVTTAEQEASDLHLVAGRHPTLRIDGSLVPLVKRPVLTPKDTKELAEAILTKEQIELFEEHKEMDLSYDFQGKARYRINVYRERGYHALALRFIPQEIKTLEELNLPIVLSKFTQQAQGLVLIVGPTGHGKSTTMASLIDIINKTQSKHIVTIEDPVEYLFIQDRCIINQREVHSDTLSFASALRHSFRQDPDVIMVGEMRDRETISTAITAAETGHLIFGTLHTNNAAQTIDRIIDIFPAEQQNQIRTQVASTLIGVISQRLLPRIEGGLIPAVEVMVSTAAVRNLIRENKIHELDTVITTGLDKGMISLDRSLANLVHMHEISLESALPYAFDQENLKRYITKN
ncbi:MAG: type IV pili twitching motility protein PilT [Parcubacteria group bacterium RIFCSPHIGHO2_01_FULL_47_10b]|nr:MAG: type IV pili twitching motility protein PilT [Parcubacteria group bacterium RIFCSPHIGHO2_01_FULL_47_10b]